MFDHQIRLEILKTLEDRQSSKINKLVYNQKTPWIRMNSLMAIDGDENLRKEWELSAGLKGNKFGLYDVYNTSDDMYTSKQEKIVTIDANSNITSVDLLNMPLLDAIDASMMQQNQPTVPAPLAVGVTRKIQYNKQYKDAGGSFGLRPMPGIKGATIKNKGSMGSTREAVVEFVCWDLNQLQMLERLYMAFGNSVLVEWGWSIDTTNGQTFRALDELVNTPISDDKALLKIIEKIKKTNGHYDAMQGIVSDFQYQLNSLGGFDCTTTITSIADMFLSMEIHSTSKNLQKEDVDSNKIIIENFKNELNSIINNKVAKNVPDSLYAGSQRYSSTQVSTEIDVPKTIYDSNNNIVRLSTNYKILPEDTVAPDIKDQIDKSSNDEIQHYTSVAYLDTIVNNSLCPKDENGQIVKLDNSNVWINYRPGIVSGDPSICLLSSYQNPSEDIILQNGKKVKDNGNYTDKYDRLKNYLGPINTPQLAAEFKDNKIKLHSILINVQYLYDTYRQSSTLSEFLITLFNKISESCGGLWHFQLHIDEDKPNIISIIDKNSEYPTTDPKTITFKVYNKDSIVKDVNVSTLVSEEIKAMTMYNTNPSASAAGNTSSYGFLLYGAHLTNLIYKNIEQGTLTANDKTFGIQYDYYGQMADAIEKLYRSYTPDISDTCKTALNKYIVDVLQIGNNVVSDKQTVILPISVSITLDGISGVKFGNIINIDYLPTRYLDSTYFMIKDVTHVINSSGWTTTFDTVIQLKSAPIL